MQKFKICTLLKNIKERSIKVIVFKNNKNYLEEDINMKKGMLYLLIALSAAALLMFVSCASKSTKAETKSYVNIAADSGFDTTKEIMAHEVYNEVSAKVIDEVKGKWHYILNLGAKAALTVEGGVLHIKIDAPGTDYWAIQLLQFPLKIENGKTYKVSFDAKAAQPRPIVTKVGRVGGDWKAYSGLKTIDIDTEMKNYSYSFKMNSETDEASRMEVNFGNSPVESWIDNIKLEIIE